MKKLNFEQMENVQGGSYCDTLMMAMCYDGCNWGYDMFDLWGTMWGAHCGGGGDGW